MAELFLCIDGFIGTGPEPQSCRPASSIKPRQGKFFCALLPAPRCPKKCRYCFWHDDVQAQLLLQGGGFSRSFVPDARPSDVIAVKRGGHHLRGIDPGASSRYPRSAAVRPPLCPSRTSPRLLLSQYHSRQPSGLVLSPGRRLSTVCRPNTAATAARAEMR